jgi:hypothetical protein
MWDAEIGADAAVHYSRIYFVAFCSFSLCVMMASRSGLTDFKNFFSCSFSQAGIASNASLYFFGSFWFQEFFDKCAQAVPYIAPSYEQEDPAAKMRARLSESNRQLPRWDLSNEYLTGINNPKATGGPGPTSGTTTFPAGNISPLRAGMPSNATPVATLDTSHTLPVAFKPLMKNRPSAAIHIPATAKILVPKRSDSVPLSGATNIVVNGEAINARPTLSMLKCNTNVR